MSDERTHHATLTLVRNFVVTGSFPDLPDAPAILFDEPAPLGEDQAPNAASYLGAAVGHCLAASLAFCLAQVARGAGDAERQRHHARRAQR